MNESLIDETEETNIVVCRERAYTVPVDVAKELTALRAELEAARKDALDAIASRLIDAWVAENGKQIPWAKAVQIIAIVTKQSKEEQDRLLHLDDKTVNAQCADTAMKEGKP